MRKVKFIALVADDGGRDGEEGWSVEVDGAAVCEVRADEKRIGDAALQPLWDALGVEIEFDFDLAPD